ncbi:GRDP2-like protein, partial [Mya arenaria]
MSNKYDMLYSMFIRYEKFWLPLAAQYPDETLCAPLDIHWVWHCHMLTPRAYLEAEKAKNLYLIGDCNNLDTQAIHLVDFLREVDQNRHIYELKNIKRAVYRYEHFWLPLAAKYPDETLCAPLDIQWVWHCHMLAPRAYVEDCKAIVGTVLDHEEKNSYERHISLNKSASYWERLYGDEPFNVNYSDTFDETMLEHFKSKISYDILSSAKRQSSFYYQVSLPHYKDRTYLLQAKERYKKFLYLRKQNVGDYLVPCYDIDLIWHTHMKTPLAYKKDTEKILGYHFNHDDSTTDRSDGSKLSNGDRVTKRKWKDLYGEPYVKAGAMYRGEPSVGTLETISKKSLFEMSEKYCCISIKKVIARRTPSDNRRKSKFKIDCWSREVDGTTKDDHLFHLTSSNAIKIDDDIFEWDVSVPVIYPKNKAIPCSNLLSLVLTEKRRVALFWSSRKETGSMEHVLNVDKIYKETEGDVSRVITLYFRLGCLDVTVEAKHTDIKAKPLKLHLSPGWYTNAIIPENIRQLWGPVPFHKLPVGVDNSCIVATHSVPLMTSVVQVFHEDQMLAISHLIGTEQLPLPTQIIQSQSEIPALNPKIGQRAMLIKNTGGDWGIVTGEWHGFKKGKTAIRVGRRTFGGVKRNLGALLVNLYKNCPENSIEHTSSSFNYNQYANWSFKLDAVQANFNHGHVNISSTTEVPENIALTFSVALLHVFCVPRPKDWTEGQRFEPKTSYFEWKTSDIRISDALTFFRAAGILHNTPSNHYIRNKPLVEVQEEEVPVGEVVEVVEADVE